MFSIICCSISPEEASALKQNVAETIGAPFEFIAFDNRVQHDGLCRVYNQCANKAKYEYLCFVHEDVRFLTSGWGNILASKLSEKDCGLIGFAGSIIKLKRLTGWNTCGKDMRANYVQHMRGGAHRKCVNPEREAFSPVVTLDGLCLAVRREVWRSFPFDEKNFPGFHCYDLDFSLSVASAYTNYVCHTVLVEHFSEGSFSKNWVESMIRLHRKWDGQLPMTARSMSVKELARYDRLGEAYFIKFMWQKGCFEVRGLRDACRYWLRHPFSGISWALFPKYLKYRLRHARSGKR